MLSSVSAEEVCLFPLCWSSFTSLWFSSSFGVPPLLCSLGLFRLTQGSCRPSMRLSCLPGVALTVLSPPLTTLWFFVLVLRSSVLPWQICPLNPVICTSCRRIWSGLIAWISFPPRLVPLTGPPRGVPSSSSTSTVQSST